MQGLQEIQSVWPLVAIIGTGVIGLTTFAVANAGNILELWRGVANRLHVTRVTDEADPDLVSLDELQSHAFDARVADGNGELRRYLMESRRGRADPADVRPHMMVFLLRYNRALCGFLTAEYFPHSQTIFLWHLLVDDQRIPHHRLYQRGAMQLLAAMVRAADATGVPWKHVITEIEAAPADIPRARAKMRLFQNAARRLSRKRRQDPVRVLKLPLDYRQPILDPALLPEAAQYEPKEWLLYAPRHPGPGVRQIGDKLVMDKAMAVQLLDTLLLKSYARAFAYSADYTRYCRSMFDEYVARLPHELVLTENAAHAQTDAGVTTPLGAPAFAGRAGPEPA